MDGAERTPLAVPLFAVRWDRRAAGVAAGYELQIARISRMIANAAAQNGASALRGARDQ